MTRSSISVDGIVHVYPASVASAQLIVRSGLDPDYLSIGSFSLSQLTKVSSETVVNGDEI